MLRPNNLFFQLFFFIIIFIQNISPDEHNHVYTEGEEVVLWMNTVGPYSNRQETYNYYSLPFCRGEKKKIEHYHETIGEALLGVELEFSGMNIRYKIDQPKNTFCKKTLTPDEADAFIFAVEHNYWWAKTTFPILLFPIMRDEMAFLDQYVAPGLRLWMLVGLVSAVLLVMIVIVCCFVRLRIPRTKRQIELRAAKRRKRKAEKTGTDFGEPHEQDPYRGGQTIVLNSFNNSGTNRPNNGGRRTTSDLARGPNAPISRSIPV